MAKKTFSYNEAIQEIEKILFEVENNETDIDQLSKKVKRVSYLLDACKNKLLKTENEIDKIIDKLNDEKSN